MLVGKQTTLNPVASKPGVGKVRPADFFGPTRLQKCEVHLFSFLKIQPRF